jgi:class 3 adenylate cyclase
MRNQRKRLSIKTELLLLFAGLLIGPNLLLGVYYYHEITRLGVGGLSEEESALLSTHLITWMLATLLLAALTTFVAGYLLKKRVLTPLHTFRSTLEDISEGFIVEEIPNEIFSKAEDVITDSFSKVISINRMLLKNVDSLERGYEEERLAKLAQAKLTAAYERFVPHEFLAFLQKESITEVQLGDHVETKMTILFSDIRDFTMLSEKISPEENFQILNDYLGQMEPIVKNHNGFIDKYIGDGIMALFNSSPDDALAAAVEMLQQLDRINEERRMSGWEPFQIGIGLNTGPMMLGIVGGVNRMEGTVISDAVNLAARIEELNKQYGTRLLVSEHLYAQLKDPARYCIRVIDRVKVKGKTHHVLIFEVFDADPPALREGKRQTLLLFNEAWTYYHQGQVELAFPLFEQVLQGNPEDTVAQFYLRRCEEKLGKYEEPLLRGSLDGR